MKYDFFAENFFPVVYGKEIEGLNRESVLGAKLKFSRNRKIAGFVPTNAGIDAAIDDASISNPSDSFDDDVNRAWLLLLFECFLGKEMQ